jgi:hypothetical protein
MRPYFIGGPVSHPGSIFEASSPAALPGWGNNGLYHFTRTTTTTPQAGDPGPAEKSLGNQVKYSRASGRDHSHILEISLPP